MEMCKEKDLFDFIVDKATSVNQSMAKYLFKQICEGVDALHTKAG